MDLIQVQEKWLNQLAHVLELRSKLKEANAKIEYDAGYWLQSDYDELQRAEEGLLVLFRELTIPQGTIADRSKSP